MPTFRVHYEVAATGEKEIRLYDAGSPAEARAKAIEAAGAAIIVHKVKLDREMAA